MGGGVGVKTENNPSDSHSKRGRGDGCPSSFHDERGGFNTTPHASDMFRRDAGGFNTTQPVLDVFRHDRGGSNTTPPVLDAFRHDWGGFNTTFPVFQEFSTRPSPRLFSTAQLQCYPGPSVLP